MRTIFEKCKLSGKAKAIDGALPAGIIPELNAQPNARNNKKQPREELLEDSYCPDNYSPIPTYNGEPTYCIEVTDTLISDTFKQDFLLL